MLQTGGVPPTPTAHRVRRMALAALVVALLGIGSAACSSGTTASPTTTESGRGPSTSRPAFDFTTTTVPDPARINLATTALGEILIDSDGMTLYASTEDPPGVSACIGLCREAWPPLIAPGVVAGTGLEPGAFSLVSRPDDSVQAAVAGRPLHRFAGDSAPGETIGQGFNGTWFVVRADGTLVDGTPIDEPDSTTTTAP